MPRRKLGRRNNNGIMFTSGHVTFHFYAAVTGEAALALGNLAQLVNNT